MNGAVSGEFRSHRIVGLVVATLCGLAVLLSAACIGLSVMEACGYAPVSETTRTALFSKVDVLVGGLMTMLVSTRVSAAQAKGAGT